MTTNACMTEHTVCHLLATSCYWNERNGTHCDAMLRTGVERRH